MSSFKPLVWHSCRVELEELGRGLPEVRDREGAVRYMQKLWRKEISQKEKKITSLEGTQTTRGLSLNSEQAFIPNQSCEPCILLS